MHFGIGFQQQSCTFFRKQPFRNICTKYDKAVANCQQLTVTVFIRFNELIAAVVTEKELPVVK